jgi:hypothetical protein
MRSLLSKIGDLYCCLAKPPEDFLTKERKIDEREE